MTSQVDSPRSPQSPRSRRAAGVTRRANLLMTADAVGGVWTYALDLARGLALSGIDTTLAVLGPAPTPQQRREAMSVPGLSLIRTGLALDWTAAERSTVVQAGRELASFAARLAPDLIHLNSPALAAEARFSAPVVAVCHSCVATWWAAVKGDAPMPDDFRWRTELTRAGYANATALIANSRSFADATARTYALAEPPLAVLNGRAAPQPTAAAAGAPSGVFAFTAGRLWDEGKGASTLDHAAARSTTPVFAAGPLTGPHGGSVRLDHVRALGRIGEAEVAEWLSPRPIFVSTAVYEPFGLAVLEAAQAGCALVLSDIPAFRELWDGAALFAPPGDDSAFAAHIDALAADPGLRAQLGGAARARARRYTVEAMAAGALDVYRSVAPAFSGLNPSEAAA